MRTRPHLFAAMLLSALPVVAGDGIQKGKYNVIEVAKFELAPGIDLPPEFQESLSEDVLKQLEHTRKFNQVLGPGQQPSDAGSARLKLAGTVIKFKPGSRATRYLVGFGAGATKIVANIRFIDGNSGTVLLERKVDGKVIIGVFGGDSKGAANGLAKELAKVTKSRFF